MNAKDVLALKQKYNEAVEKFSRPILKEIFDEFFAESPEIKSINWTQYTPGFNDGDPCTFGIHEFNYVFFSPTSEQLADEEEEGDGVSSYSLKAPFNGRANRLEAAVSNLEDMMINAFGDGSKIFVTREAFRVEDYDCGY